MPESSRRAFLRNAATVGAAVVLPLERAWSTTPAPLALQLGYASITWNGKDDQAIEDISAVGFRGIQLRVSAFERWGETPEELRRLLEDKKLSLLCLSSGNVDADPAREQEYLDTHLKHARFVKALGGRTLQLVSRRPKERAPTAEEFERLGKLLTAIGRRTGDIGVRLVYHNHMNAFGEAPDEVARVLELSDKRYVSLLLDIAHYKQGGGDPVAAVRRHRGRLALLHLKDVVSPVPGDTKPARQSYKWVELGRGSVNVPGVLRALQAISFRGPGIVELDRVPDPDRTPKQSAELNKQYVTETLGLPL